MTQIYGTAERKNSAINESPSPSESVHDNDLQWKLNGGEEFYNKISKKAVF